MLDWVQLNYFLCDGLFQVMSVALLVLLRTVSMLKLFFGINYVKSITLLIITLDNCFKINFITFPYEYFYCTEYSLVV